MHRLCRKEEERSENQPSYSVAISNSLFKEGGNTKDMPCLNCRLIEMGEMACYQERCPQCDKVPPCKKGVMDEVQSVGGNTMTNVRGIQGKIYINQGHSQGTAYRQGRGEGGGGGGGGQRYREDFSV